MDKKFTANLFKPFTILFASVMGVFCVIVLALNTWVGAAAIAICVGLYFLFQNAVDRYAGPMLEDEQQRITARQNDILSGLEASETLPACAADSSGSIVWKNFAAQELEESVGPLEELVTKPMLDRLVAGEDKKLRLEAGGRSWTVEPAPLTEGGRLLLTWRDETGFETLKKVYTESRGCVAVIGVDNYDEIISSTAVENQSLVVAEIDRCIRTWAAGMEACTIRYRNSNYALVFEQKYLEQLRAEKFPILGQMHEIETGADFPTSISVGIGCEASSFEELREQADAALDLAYGRGGDQAVIKRAAGDPEYYGGSLPSVEKRNKGRSRLFSHALMQQIAMADHVYIMGHSRPDMDAFGACVGIYRLVLNMHTAADIIIDTGYEAIEELYKASREGDYRFISAEDAARNLTPESLLVVCDCHAAYMTESPELVERANKIIIIDHHRRSKDVIENASLVYMESYASSTCELVAEMLQYAGERSHIGKFDAEAMLAGITLDTKNFTVSAGARTFDAASWLKRQGADTAVVKSFFKLRLDLVQKKYNILANTQVMDGGVAVAYTKESDPTMQVLAAQAADELLDMRGIEAAFTAGSTGERTVISARSSGGINVQTIMERMGGGGHRNGAAAQVEVSPEEAIQQLVQMLREDGIIE